MFIGQWALPQDNSITTPTLNFYPADNFTGETAFTFRMVDNSGNISDATYTVTVKPKGSAPSKPQSLSLPPARQYEGRSDLAQPRTTAPSPSTNTAYKKVTDSVLRQLADNLRNIH